MHKTYSLKGHSCRCGKFGFSLVQNRWLLVHYFGKTFKIEVVPYVIWCFAWMAMLGIGYVAFHEAQPNPFTPHHIMFDLFVLVSISYVLGNILSALVSLPPLFGFMIIGMCVANISALPTDGISDHFSTVVKEIALTIIVGRAGLGLPVNTFLGDAHGMRTKELDAEGAVSWHEISTWGRFKASFGRLKTGLLLAVTPMSFEAGAYALMAMLVFQFDPMMGLLLGFVMAAVSPAVVVPGLIDLQNRGYVGGTATSAPVPSIVMFASGLDDIFAITLFGIFLGLSFGGGDPLIKVVKAPLEIVGGVFFGFLLGYIMYVICGRLVPKEYSDFDAEAQVRIRERDMNKYGFVHPADKYSNEMYRIPKATKSHQLIFFVVFLSCVAFVLGTASIEIGDAGTLSSLGVLGAMAACLCINYLFSQASFQMTVIENDAKMIHWVQATRPDLENDEKTRKFFHIGRDQGIEDKIREYKLKMEKLEILAARHQKALSLLNLHMKIIWDVVACPLLFALVGKSIDFGKLFDPDVLPKALIVIGVSLLARCAGAMVACIGSGWGLKNRLFVAFAWLPKATVQAAVGGLAIVEAEVALNECLRENKGDVTKCTDAQEKLEWAEIILQVSVTGIILTAPMGAAAISLLGPKWLEQRKVVNEVHDEDTTHEDHHDVAQFEHEHGIPMSSLDRPSVIQFMSERARQRSLLDINAAADICGNYPPARDAMRTKRAASFPCSRALGNPVAHQKYVGDGHHSDAPRLGHHLSNISFSDRNGTASFGDVGMKTCDTTNHGGQDTSAVEIDLEGVPHDFSEGGSFASISP